jgi:hypothetical protein
MWAGDWQSPSQDQKHHVCGTGNPPGFKAAKNTVGAANLYESLFWTRPRATADTAEHAVKPLGQSFHRWTGQSLSVENQ